MPRHVNPEEPERTATAPYNFVPLPERVFTVDDGIEVGEEKIWERHDRFVPGTHSGWIDLTIETLTPLYLRGAVEKRDGKWDGRDSSPRPEPYRAPDGRPAIPGSSLRGMVRTLVEILSFSKIQPVSEAEPFFRTVADDRIGQAYRNRMTAADQKPRGGILRVGDGAVTIEPREVRRVQRSMLGASGVVFQPGPNFTPPWPQQHARCWVKVSAGSESVDEIRIQNGRPTGSDWQPATLVLTGNAPKKKREFVFLEPEDTTPPVVSVPDRIWRRFHDEDQITQWQERAFPRDKPRQRCRKNDGHLRHGEPVFFLVDERRKPDDNPDGLVFVGRAGMFRFPYDRSPADLVPQHLRKAGLDLAEAMFGKVDKVAIKGRVHFEDAVATNGGPNWCEPALVPRILSAPKPTAVQHYLTQDGRKEEDQLTTYLEGDHTTIRGHKLYWHRWGSDGLNQVKENRDHDALLRDFQSEKPKDTQHTRIRPVKAGVTFAGRIRFENLTDLELGALLCALQLPEGCCHRLGMGKPLGLGSVRVTARPRLLDRATRYRTWQVSGVQGNEDGSRFRTAFEQKMLEHARASREAMLDGKQGLRQIARLDALFRLLDWEDRPDAQATRYMLIEGGDSQRYPADTQGKVNEFHTRPVLPTPHRVARADEPPWPSDPPRPAPDDGGGPPGRPSASARTRQTTGGRARTASPKPGPASGTPKPRDRVEAVLLEERTKKGGWKARHESSGLEGPIQNSDLVPSDKKPGDRVPVVVKVAKGRESAFEFVTEVGAARSERKGKK